MRHEQYLCNSQRDHQSSLELLHLQPLLHPMALELEMEVGSEMRMDLKMAQELLDGVAAREAAGIPTARLFRREMKMARALLRAGEAKAR